MTPLRPSFGVGGTRAQHPSAADLVETGKVREAMITPCESCGHKLWSVVRKVDEWVLRVHFDGEESSETYADQVMCCPECGKLLAEPAVREYFGVRVR